MVEGLIEWLVVIVVVAIIASLALYALAEAHVQEPFNRLLRVVVILIAVLIIIYKGLPLIGMAI